MAVAGRWSDFRSSGADPATSWYVRHSVRPPSNLVARLLRRTSRWRPPCSGRSDTLFRPSRGRPFTRPSTDQDPVGSRSTGRDALLTLAGVVAFRDRGGGIPARASGAVPAGVISIPARARAGWNTRSMG